MTEIFLILMSLCNASGLFLVKSAAELDGGFWARFRSPRLPAGLALMAFSPLLMALAANYCSLSRMTAFSSLSYIFILLLSYFFLREKLDWRKIAGSLLIVTGILLLK